MRIAVLVYEYPPKTVGGLGTYAAETTRRFVLLGHDVSVFTMNDDEGSLPVREMWSGIEIHRPLDVDIADSLPHIMTQDIRKWGRGIKLFSKILTYNILSAHKIINEIVRKERLRYDIVVSHDWLSTIAGITMKRELNLPFVFHVHSTEKGRTLGNGSEMINNIEYQGGQVADRVITVSHAMKDELVELNFATEKVQVCYNGVDPQKYERSRISEEEIHRIRDSYGIGEDEFFILFLGRLVAVKGADKLIMAMPHILQKVPNAKLVIVGKGGMEEYLMRLAYELRLQNAVKFCFRFLPEEERIAHYAACDLAAFPSMYEPFGIVALEAMSMEKPVVVGANGVSGMREVVIPHGQDQCGFHVNPNIPADIAWGVLCALQDPNQMLRLGKNGRRRVLEEFSWDLAIGRTIESYEQLLSLKKV